MSNNFKKYLGTITILFALSLIGLSLHVLDDAYVTSEPLWYRISIGEFLLSCAVIYLILPPIGLWLTWHGKIIGLGILMLYTLQALYGAGLNHIKHLFGTFQGSGALPAIFNVLNIDYRPYLTAHGFLSVVLNMAGLGVTPPHTHTLTSNLIVFGNVGINTVLIGFITLQIFQMYRQSRTVSRSGT